MKRFTLCCFLLALVVSAPAHAVAPVNMSISIGNAPPPPVLVFRGGQKTGQHVGLTTRDKLAALLGV